MANGSEFVAALAMKPGGMAIFKASAIKISARATLRCDLAQVMKPAPLATDLAQAHELLQLRDHAIMRRSVGDRLDEAALFVEQVDG